jgi:hypothetical protein
MDFAGEPKIRAEAAKMPRAPRREVHRARISKAFLYPLSRYSGGGLGWGFLRRFRSNPHPSPPPEYRERETQNRVNSSLGALGVLAVLAQVFLSFSAAPARGDVIRTFSTSHYQIQTDLDADFAKELAVRMDAMYDEYSRRFAGIAQPGGDKPLKVYLFARRSDYLQLVGPGYQHTGGLFMPTRGALAAFVEGQGRDGLRRTLQHEAFHQFAYRAVGERLPPWLNEGLAQVFEEALWTGNEFFLYEIPPRRVRQLREDLQAGRLIDFSTLAMLTAEQWSAPLSDDSAAAAARYNQAWAITHFLATGHDGQGNPYLPRLLSLLQALHSGRDSREAMARVFPDAGAIHHQFLDFAANLKPTPTAQLLERQAVLADLIVELSARDPVPHQMSRVRRLLREGGYQIHYWRGSVRWDSQADLQIYFTDLSNRLFDANALFFEAGNQPIPDIVCRWCDRYQFRTHFEFTTEKPEHQTTIEPVK